MISEVVESVFARAKPLGLMLLVLALAVTGRVAAQSDVPREETWVADGAVYAIATTPTTTYLGGDFGYVGPQTGGWVPIAADTGFVAEDYPKVNGYVYACVPDGTGGWYIGGAFSNVGGLPRCNVAHILASGTVDPVWRPEPDGLIFAIVALADSVFVSGGFRHIDGESRSCLAALDAVSGAVTAWDPNCWAAEHPSALVNALAISDSTVYAGGIFTHIGTKARRNIAAIDAHSGVATDWNPSTDAIVYNLTAGGGFLYAMGDFTTIGGQSRRYMAQLNLTTGEVTGWDPQPSGGVKTVAVSGGTVYVGGWFTHIGGEISARVAALDAVSGLITASLDAPDSTVNALAVGDGVLYASGSFEKVGGEPRTRLASFDLATGQVTPWDPKADTHAYALSCGENKVYACGWLASVGGVCRTNVAALDAVSGAATDWYPEPRGTIRALAASEDTVYLGGTYLEVQDGGDWYTGVVALDAATATVKPWTPHDWDSGYSYDVYALALSSGRLYAGGPFTRIGGHPRRGIAAIDPETGIPLAWDPDIDGYVNALTVSDGTVYAGGAFSSVGGQPRSNMAAIDAVTGSPTPWAPGTDGEVRALALSGGTVYVGGDFSSAGGENRHRIAALDAVTGAATPWSPATADSASDCIHALALSGTTVYAGGQFTRLGGEARQALAGLNTADGTATGWHPILWPPVYAIALSERALYAGGGFLRLSSTTAAHFAAFANPGFAFTQVPRGGVFVEGHRLSMQVGFTGTVGPTYVQWRKDGEEIPGSTAATFTIPHLALSDAGEYDVYVTDEAKAIYPSPIASVAVLDSDAVPTVGGVGLAILAVLFAAAGVTRLRPKPTKMPCGRRQ